MSGHKVVAILEAFKEGYVYGNTVYRRKQSVLEGSKGPSYAVVPSNSKLAATPSSVINNRPATASSSNTLVDLVLSHKGAFKLRSKMPPKKSATAAKAAGGVKKFSQRGNNTAATNHTDPNAEDDDDDIDPLDADAMMMAAANGEDIQRLYAMVRAKREAKARAKEGAGGAGGGASVAGGNKPEVVWRQEHCFVRAVTPLLGPEAEDEEDTYRRRDEEEEAERLRAEEEEAKQVLENALKGASGNVNHASHRRVTAAKYENADGMADNNAKNVMSLEMEKRRALTPSELANDRSIKDRQLNGFVVHYFAIGKNPKRAEEELSYGRQLTASVKGALGTVSAAVQSSVPTIRYRTYVCGSHYEQEEWVMVYRNTLLNYWHERLETSVIMAPEVFQYQCFGMHLGSSAPPSSSSFLNSSYPVGGVIHCVLSTTAFYVLPRSNKSEFEVDDTNRYVRMPVDALANISIDRANGTCAVTGGPFTPSNPLRLAFFRPMECAEFVIELQRIWDMASPLAASAEASFPYTLV